MAYRLNRQLVLEAPQRVADGAGGFNESWAALGIVWANVKARSGREKAGVAAPLSLVSYQIVVRAAPVGSDARPQAEQRFREGERYYRILSVTEDDADGRYLICTSQEETVA
ncbi:head-tail adaptor protein [Octadecabacter sp. 1_MG-2023]|uniref:head-tail adaptor protein n=1 Tax=unclassified Octadecabacter TaxID=196158 RepID=UPI001C08391E|nr:MULTISPECIES: head-tail adaptor protein [unclassified Octadecabacter]MBU2993704.1 head-tail adaptor protein [Octadecabacter sp. B2R22]MDO6735452.1 head-tail adaptor protein [Octadecabacter sp. 1_MG-2023]